MEEDIWQKIHYEIEHQLYDLEIGNGEGDFIAKIYNKNGELLDKEDTNASSLEDFNNPWEIDEGEYIVFEENEDADTAKQRANTAIHNIKNILKNEGYKLVKI